MRKIYLVAYDISNSKRLTKVYKTLRSYGDHAQYSVFICNLSPKEKVLLQGDLEGIINFKEDQVMLVDLGPPDGRGDNCIETIGKAFIKPERHAIVI